MFVIPDPLSRLLLYRRISEKIYLFIKIPGNEILLVFVDGDLQNDVCIFVEERLFDQSYIP
jgi:hypothetical protein